MHGSPHRHSCGIVREAGVTYFSACNWSGDKNPAFSLADHEALTVDDDSVEVLRHTASVIDFKNARFFRASRVQLG